MLANHPLSRLALIVVLLSGLAAAQKPVIGYFEFKDERSGAVGLRKHFLDQEGIETRFFDIASPGSFKPHEYDVIMFGSFSEFHPAWNDFVLREKDALLAQVERGALLVLFNRHRKNDRNNEKLTLLPPGYSVMRSGNDFSEIYFSEVLHPMWKGMTQRPSRGWHMLDGGKIGRKDQPALLDAFEDWSQNLKKSAGPQKRDRGGWAAALSGDYGQGELMLFQLTYDKLEEATGRRSREAAREFMKALIVYIGRRPKFAKPQPIAGGDPPADDPVPPRDEPVPPRPKETVLLRARVFEDVDGDGDYDAGEPTLSGVRVVDGNASSLTGSTGLAMTEASRRTDRVLRIDVPDGYDATSGWFVEVPFTTIGDLDAVDVFFPLTPLRPNAARRVLFARLDRLEEGGAAERVALALEALFARESPDLAVLLIDGPAAERASGRMIRIEEQIAETGLPVRVVAASSARTRTGGPFGPPEASFELGGATFVTTSGVDDLERLARRGPDPRTVVFLAGTAPTSVVSELVAAGAVAVIAASGPADVAALALAPRLAADGDAVGYGIVDVDGVAVTVRIGPVETDSVRDDGEAGDPPAPVLPVRETHPHVKGSLEAAVKAALDESSKAAPQGVEKPVAIPSRPTAALSARRMVAHRGGAAEAPENTLTAIAKAIALKCGAVEVDVRLTGDGEVVLFRGDAIGSGNGDLTGKAVKSVPYFELRKVDVGAPTRRESPPLLADVLALDWGETRLMVDARPDGNAAALGAACAAVVGASSSAGNVDFASVDADVLRAFHSAAAGVPLAAMIKRAADVPRFDGLSIAIWVVDGTSLEESVASFLSKGGREIRVGVVNDAKDAVRLLAIPGVTAIVTDAPAKLIGE